MELTYTLAQLDGAADLVISNAGDKKLWAFEGEMGAGKTTLIKNICKKLGVTSDISSPTFSLVNEYHTKTNKVVYHFDFYRIKSIEEVYDIGYEDYFYSGHICLIEWPGMISELLYDDETLRILISRIDETTRRIVVS